MSSGGYAQAPLVRPFRAHEPKDSFIDKLAAEEPVRTKRAFVRKFQLLQNPDRTRISGVGVGSNSL
jgi:hypothetical protein